MGLIKIKDRKNLVITMNVEMSARESSSAPQNENSKTLKRPPLYYAALCLGLMLFVYYVLSRDVLVYIAKEEVGESKSLLIVSLEDVLEAQRACRCSLGCHCIREMALDALADQRIEETVSVFVHRACDIDVLFRYDVAASPWYVPCVQSYKPEVPHKVAALFGTVRYVFWENARYFNRLLAEKDSKLVAHVLVKLVIVSYAFVFYLLRSFFVAPRIHERKGIFSQVLSADPPY